MELLLLGFGPPLLTLGPAQIEVDRERVSCSYPIRGGLLVRRAGGTLSLAQTGLERPELCVAVNGFFPRPSFLYEPVQRRFHAFVSRRYFRRLVAEGQQ